MATIDKPLPNISETVVEVPKQEELGSGLSIVAIIIPLYF